MVYTIEYVSIDTFGLSKRRITKQFNVNLTGEVPSVSERKKGKKDGTRMEDSSWYYLGAVGQIGFAIAIPIAGGALVGSYLDRSWGTYPKMTLGLLMFGLVVSGVNFYRTVQEILKK